MKKGQNLASQNVVNYTVEKMEVIPGNEFSGYEYGQISRGFQHLNSSHLRGKKEVVFTSFRVYVSSKTR